MPRPCPFRVLPCDLAGLWALVVGCGVALLPARPVDLRARGEGVVEYPGKVACPSGRRCSTRNAVWCHSHPGFKSQRYRHCRPAPVGPGGFVMPTCCAAVRCVAPLVFRAPEGPAAREARRPHFVRRRASKPTRALRTLRRPPHQWGWVADVCLCFASKPDQALPPPARVAAWPSGPSGALHPSGARSLMLLGALACCLARPRRLLWASRGSRVLSFWGGLVCVVTNVVNLMAFWLKMVVTGQFAR